MYEAIEKVLTTELLEQNVFKLPGIATLFRKELPARPDMGEKYVCGRLVKVPARGDRSVNSAEGEYGTAC